MNQVLDHGYCDLVESWGSDETIIAGARMSTSGAFKGWGPIHENPEVCKLHPEYCHCALKAGDEKLLKYLWEHKHTSPFEMAGLTVEVQAPIFVVREWMRHRTQSFAELSSRYSELPDLYYLPSIERLMDGRQATKNKQGSASGFTAEQALGLRDELAATSEYCRNTYEYLLKAGLSRELARLIVPVNQFSRFRASANLWNWLRFLGLRLGEGVQWEMREYALAVSEIVKEKFPRTYTLFEASK